MANAEYLAHSDCSWGCCTDRRYYLKAFPSIPNRQIPLGFQQISSRQRSSREWSTDTRGISSTWMKHARTNCLLVFLSVFALANLRINSTTMNRFKRQTLQLMRFSHSLSQSSIVLWHCGTVLPFEWMAWIILTYLQSASSVGLDFCHIPDSYQRFATTREENHRAAHHPTSGSCGLTGEFRTMCAIWLWATQKKKRKTDEDLSATRTGEIHENVRKIVRHICNTGNRQPKNNFGISGPAKSTFCREKSPCLCLETLHVFHQRPRGWRVYF